MVDPPSPPPIPPAAPDLPGAAATAAAGFVRAADNPLTSKENYRQEGAKRDQGRQAGPHAFLVARAPSDQSRESSRGSLRARARGIGSRLSAARAVGPRPEHEGCNADQHQRPDAHHAGNGASPGTVTDTRTTNGTTSLSSSAAVPRAPSAQQGRRRRRSSTASSRKRLATRSRPRRDHIATAAPQSSLNQVVAAGCGRTSTPRPPS